VAATLDEILKKLNEIKQDIDVAFRGQVLSAQQVQVLNGLSDIDTRLGLIQAGEFRSGNGLDPGKGFSGVRIVYPPVLYNSEEWNIAGVNNDVLQVGIRAADGKLIAGGGDVFLDQYGVNFKNVEGAIFFEDSAGNQYAMRIYGSFDDALTLNSDVEGGAIRFFVTGINAASMLTSISEDTEQADKLRLNLSREANGARFSIDSEISLDGRGTSAGSTRLRFRGVSNNTPADPDPNYDEVNIYIRNEKFIIQYHDGATVRYKYLDLTGTGTTWTHTTSAP
jgi:hypothetical protein